MRRQNDGTDKEMVILRAYLKEDGLVSFKCDGVNREELQKKVTSADKGIGTPYLLFNQKIVEFNPTSGFNFPWLATAFK
jgi:hypothetical protein